MTDHRIVGIHVTDRAQAAGRVQEILSKYGKNIRTRLGLHDVHDDVVAKFYSYGDVPPRGDCPSSAHIYQPDGYEYLKREYPQLDYIETCRILERQESGKDEL